MLYAGHNPLWKHGLCPVLSLTAYSQTAVLCIAILTPQSSVTCAKLFLRPLHCTSRLTGCNICTQRTAAEPVGANNGYKWEIDMPLKFPSTCEHSLLLALGLALEKEMSSKHRRLGELESIRQLWILTALQGRMVNPTCTPSSTQDLAMTTRGASRRNM